MGKKAVILSRYQYPTLVSVFANVIRRLSLRNFANWMDHRLGNLAEQDLG